MQSDNKYILWLVSWYPNPQSPFEGDFIQRHAYAASAFTPIVLVHVMQYGSDTKINENKIEINKTGNLTEIIISFLFLKTGIKFIDKIIYNLRYYAVYKKYIRNYFRKNGLPSLVHVHVPMKAGMLARWIKRKWNIPYIINEHASTYEETSVDFFLRRSLRYKRSVYKIFRDADIITNVSAKSGEKVNRLIQLSKPVKVIPNVVDESLFFYKESDQPLFTFIHVSSFNRQKNIYELLSVIKLLQEIRNDWRLLLVGPADEKLKEFVSGLKLTEQVFFTGEVPYQKVAEYMQQSSALVLFSIHENFPCVIEEALCCGLPVITSDIGGISEAIDNSNGILIPMNDKDELLSALQKIMDEYSLYNRKEISKKATALYNRKIIGEEINSLYNIIKSNHPSSSNSSS